MFYQSTRNSSLRVTSSQAIVQGISADGGLFVPCQLPVFDMDAILRLSGLDYVGRAKAVLSAFLTDFTPEEIDRCVAQAYTGGKFEKDVPAPVKTLCDGLSVLELWHGPTCAFKDMALQLLPGLMTVSAEKQADGKTVAILVATSGDTGKAALEGFKDVKGTKIMVFYPVHGVSPMQKLQMITQEGENVAVCAIEGNFDDAQTGVKAIFSDREFAKSLQAKNVLLSSANSINWGRLVPQIVYYFSAYCDLLASGGIAKGEKVNFVVPTGNFGNILAAFYAGKMGVPIHKLICASNRNNVLTDFFRTGRYDRNRPFFATNSPSMDILISSNLERLLYDVLDRDDSRVSALMRSLSADGSYQIDEQAAASLEGLFWAGFCGEGETQKQIKKMFDQYGYLSDTHTAVAFHVYDEYFRRTGDKTRTVVVSTASPYKFSRSVCDALSGGEKLDEFEMVRRLSQLTGVMPPEALMAVEQKTPRFHDCCAKEEMREKVVQMLKF